MIVKIPTFYRNFKCTASRCSDSCCIGWEIDIDPDKAALYETAGGEFGKRLRENIAADDCVHFKLTENERCPFLNSRNLCDIILNMGEDCICEICREHPRFHSWYGNYKESGLGLCCEEAVRLLLASELKFEDIETDEEEDSYPFDEDVFKTVYAFREKLFKLFGKKQNIFDKLDKMLSLCGEFQNGKCDAPEFNSVIDYALSSEPIDGEWSEKINEIAGRKDFIFSRLSDLGEKDNGVYSEIAVYLIYRHILSSGVYGNGVIEKARFIYFFLMLLRCFDIIYPDNEIGNIKLLSKQFEYIE